MTFLLFQSMQRGSKRCAGRTGLRVQGHLGLRESQLSRAPLRRARLFRDDTNWWVPNRACTEAMLRSAGFAIDKQSRRKSISAGRRPFPTAVGPAAVYPARSRCA